MAKDSERHTALSPLEQQLLRRLAQGKLDKVIAQEIGGTEEQVAAQRQALVQKLNIQYRFQLCAAVNKLAPWPELS
jgi:DNA-binding NarL/FixJ family response regulator